MNMKVKCGINGEFIEAVGAISVCHHCGMPVCETHGWVVAADEAFAAVPPAGPVPPKAGVRPVPPKAGVRPVPSAAPPAMHCRSCVDKYHPLADKRHGWAAPQPPAGGPVGPVVRR